MEPMLTEQVPVDWHHEVLEQLEFHWNHLRRRLEGLTDEEYLWEPVPGWSLRVDQDGAGRLDRVVPAPEPPPFTTIAWRLCHLIGDVLGSRSHRHFGDDRFDPQHLAWPLGATAALELLDEAHDAWVRGVASLGVEGLHRRSMTSEVGYHGPSMASLVLHINREVIHHGAEISCLRDLYRDWFHAR
jgi:hypothetical protein